MRHHVTAHVILLTDCSCASACLDFVNVMLRIPGVTHVGKETSADAVYIENRAAPLPSNYGRLSFSMNVFRNRPRANNQSYAPAHTWSGDMHERAALERWILELIEP